MKTAARYHRRFRWRGGVGTLLLVPATIITLFSAPLVPPDSWEHVVIRGFAWAAFIAGAGMRFWVTLYLGGRKEKEIVHEGPYSVVRHPLYLGSLLIGVSAALFLESIAFGVALIVVALVYATATIPVEEGVLRARHPEAFEQYFAHVPRYWPSLRRFHTPAELHVNVHALRLECSRASRWMWIPIVSETVTFLRGLPWWPHLFRIM
jgi:protein-S-isoprenylcysteine O-methyltransferase Ste14